MTLALRVFPVPTQAISQAWVMTTVRRTSTPAGERGEMNSWKKREGHEKRGSRQELGRWLDGRAVSVTVNMFSSSDIPARLGRVNTWRQLAAAVLSWASEG
ncbi:hypothetical protein RRG08_040987 [Elysia crispata]|uniref:Uncharacterized protein n=1 Tax=Elysia crispata TaxID=231223 RepID=A0AAE0ZIY3_9GAST|nr:hypothetical protein RRG08_040987 [Elysia crispata]